MHRNIFQHKQQNAVVNECCKHASVSAKELFLGERTWGNLYCVHSAYIIVTGIYNNTKIRFKGTSRDR